MPTFLQWWFIAGELTVVEMLLQRAFCDEFRDAARSHQRQHFSSDRKMFVIATVAFAFIVATWPIFAFRSWFK